MIVTKLMGGLGNQMFQYAAARGLASKHKSQVGIDTSWFSLSNQVDAPRHYELGCFSIQPLFVEANKDFIVVKNVPSSAINKTLRNIVNGLGKRRLFQYVESDFAYNPGFSELTDNTLLDGYWQSEKYFLHVRNQLLEGFEFKNPPSEKNQKLMEQIRTTNAVSLHVRRGDYVNNKKTNAFHGTVGLDYYAAATKLITQKTENAHFYVFSDEPEWCKKNLKLEQPATYVSHNKDGSEDMRLMTACKHNIIANSSFSWWGAWLNKNSDKMIVAPTRWFADKSIDTSDVIPSSWIKI